MQKKTGKDKMTPFWARIAFVRRLDSFAQAACLSCHPFTNLLSKIDKKMAGPPISQSRYVFAHFLYFTKVHAIWLYKDHPYKDQY